MTDKRVPLYDRLPRVYAKKDERQWPPWQLKSYLELVEEILGEVHANIQGMYDDFFIESCNTWVIPYIGDLLGTSHLKGSPWSLRADVADTIALRRRKGTIGAIELLTYNLTQWGVHCVELFNNLTWNHHLNHLRPDTTEPPFYWPRRPHEVHSGSHPPSETNSPVRGGTVPVRNPAMLSLLNSPFDPFGHLADLKPAAGDAIRYNIPNLAIFLWRLESYRIPVSRPFAHGLIDHEDPSIPGARFTARFDVHPLAEPLILFNTHRFDPTRTPPVITRVDEVGGPIHRARLNSIDGSGNSTNYLAISTYEHNNHGSYTLSPVGLQLHLPESVFEGEEYPQEPHEEVWTFRGENLCMWEVGIHPPLEDHQIAVDPETGRFIVGLDDQEQAEELFARLMITYSYGSVGPVGSHPMSRSDQPEEFMGETATRIDINFHLNPTGLQEALALVSESNSPVVIEIHDSMVHDLDLALVYGTFIEDGGPNLMLHNSLVIRAADSQRPIVRIVSPLRFRPSTVHDSNPDNQDNLDALMARLTVRLEGVYITHHPEFPSNGNEPLIARSAVHAVEIIDCTLDPGGKRLLKGPGGSSRSPTRVSMRLAEPYGFDLEDELAFNQTPEIIVRRSITGPLVIDTGYALYIDDSVIDGGSGTGIPANTAGYAVAGGVLPDGSSGWGPPSRFNGVTFLGTVRVETITAASTLFVHSLAVLDNQQGCIRNSYLRTKDETTPQNIGCVTAATAHLRFVSETFGHPAYAQLSRSCDIRILEQGMNRLQPSQHSFGTDHNRFRQNHENPHLLVTGDQMGAYGFLLEAHKWRNLQIRYREFMPVDIRPVLIPVS